MFLAFLLYIPKSITGVMPYPFKDIPATAIINRQKVAIQKKRTFWKIHIAL